LISIDEKRFDEIITKSRSKKVLVIGDLMVDQYLMGDVTRISPEAPVPVIEVKGESLKFGGAANVALNILSLGCIPILVGIIGKDRMGDEFLKLMSECGIDTRGILVSSHRPTTVKTRIIGQSQHIARVDRENKEYLNKDEEIQLNEIIESIISQSDSIILEDYNKGVLTKNIIEQTINLANTNDILITVDPKFINFMLYKKVTMFKPNIKETEEALATKIQNDADLEKAGKILLEKLNNENILITKGSKGMSLFSKDGSIRHIPTGARKVADVSGAGDTVISTLTAALMGGASKEEAVTLSNFAAGIVCEEVGIIPVDLSKLREVFID
jgi:D-glycero-beta-D-manno-heptose-7-phosphate kinase